MGTVRPAGRSLGAGTVAKRGRKLEEEELRARFGSVSWRTEPLLTHGLLSVNASPVGWQQSPQRPVRSLRSFHRQHSNSRLRTCWSLSRSKLPHLAGLELQHLDPLPVERRGPVLEDDPIPRTFRLQEDDPGASRVLHLCDRRVPPFAA